MKAVIIQGSARKEGDTAKIVQKVATKLECEVVDLLEYNISYYDYNHGNINDDFLPLIRWIIRSHDVIIFATPVYWYSMSAIMKNFFDRISDLLTIDKDLGRELRGKHMAAFSTSNGNSLGDRFWIPFKESADYLGMTYLGDMHTFSGEVEEGIFDEFINKIESVKTEA